MPSEHKPSVKYSAEVLSGVPLPPGWTARKNRDGTVGVEGPCPKCLGRAFGPTLPIVDAATLDAEPFLLRARADESWQVVAACDCGFAHGRPDASSCGRTFAVNVVPEASV